MYYHWNWGILFAQEPGGSGTYLEYLLGGLGWTLATALAAWVVALAIGGVVGTLRTTSHPWVVRLLVPRGALPRSLHVGAHRGADQGLDPVAAARPALRRHRHGPHGVADV